VEAGNRVSAFNMLANSNFNTLVSGIPTGYTFSSSNIAVETVESKDHRNGGNSVKITSTSGDVYLALDQQVKLEPNTDYTLSFWVKGQGIESDNPYTLAVGPLFTYTTEGDEFDWRMVTLAFSTGEEEQNLDLKLGLFGTPGTVWFDALTLKKGNALVTASYTKDGNYLESITDASGIEVARYDYSHPEGSDEYLHRGIYSSVTDSSGNRQDYNYDILDRVISVQDAQSEVSQSYSYNSSDNLEKISQVHISV